MLGSFTDFSNDALFAGSVLENTVEYDEAGNNAVAVVVLELVN